MSETAPKFVSIGSVAEALGVSREWVRQLEAAGVIPQASRLDPGGRQVWSSDDLAVICERVKAKRAAGRQQGDRVSIA